MISLSKVKRQKRSGRERCNRMASCLTFAKRKPQWKDALILLAQLGVPLAIGVCPSRHIFEAGPGGVWPGLFAYLVVLQIADIELGYRIDLQHHPPPATPPPP